MKHLYRLVVIGIVSIGVSATPFLTRAAAPTIFISEVSWAGSSLSASDEFIELYNASDETISLTDWSLHGAATSGEALALPKDAAIPPYSTYLIANYDINEDNSALLSAPDLVTPQLALPNTKLSVALVDARGTVLDRVGTGIGSPPAGSAGVSLMRVDASADGTSDEAWAATSVSLGFKTNLIDLGTPGAHDWIETQEAEVGEEVFEPASAPEAKTNVEVISEPEPASMMEVEVNVETVPEPDPIQVHPSQDDVITVIYRGFVFELNLPKQNIVESLSSTTTSIEAPNVPATNNVVQTVSPPTSELAKLMASAADSASASDTKTETVPEELEPTIPAMSLQTLRFSEIYPNTVGNDEEEEYIEIENFGNAPVDLLGWSIQDAAEKIWTADGSFKLKAGEVIALPRVLTKIVLNNNEETLTLTHPNRQVIDVISYGKAEKGATYTRAGNAWSWQSPTPNIVETAAARETAGAEATGTLVVPDVVVSARVAVQTSSSASSSTSEPPMAIVLKTTEETISLDETEESSGKASSSKSATPSGFRAMSIAQARTTDLGTSVRVEGVVTALPGIFASQSFYMENGEDMQSRAGVQVYLHSADFPPLALGDRIRVSGVTSQNRGEARIKLSGREAIEVLGSGLADAQDIQLDTVGEVTEARLVTVEALVESARSDEMTLVEGEATLRVASRERTSVSFAAIPSGSRVRVTGIVSELNGTYTLLPRSQSDISIVEMPANENPVAAGIVNASKPPTGLYGGLLLLGMLATLGFWIARSRKDQDLTLTNA